LQEVRRAAIKLYRHPLIPRIPRLVAAQTFVALDRLLAPFHIGGWTRGVNCRYARHFLKLAETTSNCRVIPMTWKEEEELEKKLQKKRKKYRAVYRKAHKRGR